MLIKSHNRHGIQKVCQSCCEAQRRLVALARLAVRLAVLLSATRLKEETIG
jgi:hypothetical protein